MCLCNLSATNDLLYTLGQIKEVGNYKFVQT